MYLLKLNSIGDSIGSERYGHNGYEESQEFERLTNGDYLLTGHSSSSDPNHDIYAVKVDSMGQIIWENHYGGQDHDGGQSVLINSDGNYVIIGRTMSYGAGKRDILMITINPSGNLLSQKEFGGTENDRSDEILEYGDSYFIIGQSNSFGNGDNDVIVIRHKKES